MAALRLSLFVHSTLAKREGVSPSYFTRLVRLSYLAPDIAQAIVDGRQPRECPNRVTGGKTPSEYIFSELPQVADIAKSPFHHVASPLVSQITAFWVQAIPG